MLHQLYPSVNKPKAGGTQLISESQRHRMHFGPARDNFSGKLNMNALPFRSTFTVSSIRY